MTNAPAVRARPGGGFSQSLGQFSDEHIDESAMQQMMAQKGLQQQQSSTQPQSGKSGTNPLVPPMSADQGISPREIGSFKDELLTRPVKDVQQGLLSMFDINSLLGINVADTANEQARKREFKSRYDQMTEAEKQVAQRNYQMAMQKKKHEKEQEEMQKQRAEQQKKQAIAMPTSTKKGPVGPGGGSKKANTMAQLEQDRKTMDSSGKKF